MHGTVNNVQILLAENYVLIYHSFLNRHHVVKIHLTSDNGDKVFVAFELYIFDFYLIHFIYNTCVMWCQYLCAITPICLVTVVLAGIVAGGYVYAGNCTKLADGKADFGSGAEALEEINLYTVSAENICYALSKHTSVIATVVTNDHTLSTFRKSFVNIVGESLSCHANNVFVHTVGTGTHNAAQTACAELQTLVESIY